MFPMPKQRVSISFGLLISASGLFAASSCEHLQVPDGQDPGSTGLGDTSVGPRDESGPIDKTTDGEAPDTAKTSCGDKTYSDPWSPGYAIDPGAVDAAKAVVGSMSITEKADQ